jgi:hypothetical protein
MLRPPDQETRRAASAKGSPNRKPDTTKNTNTTETEQAQTALAAAMRAAMRKVVRI